MKTYAVFDQSFFTQKPWWMPYKLYNVVCRRANPRSRAYMLDLLQKKNPEAKIIKPSELPDSGNLILLYSDSIGLGWRHLESKYIKKFNQIQVLNGRQRFFNLTRGVRIQLCLKRFLEMSFFPEIVFAPCLLVLGVFLALKDKWMGRVS